jgi:DNA mismatch endonuclease (patch repair protein)
MRRQTASYLGLRPASERASAAARGASRKSGTKPELLLRRALKRTGVRVSTTRLVLSGKPDLVFVQARIVVFVDGDYWHGRSWKARKSKLQQGTNAAYWVAKIDGNRKRDRRNNLALSADGWTVLRFWETDITCRADAIAGKVAKAIATKLSPQGRSGPRVTPPGQLRAGVTRSG